MGLFKDFLDEGKYVRLFDEPTSSKSISPSANITYLQKYNLPPKIKISREFFTRAQQRNLSESEFRFIYDQILEKENEMYERSKMIEQFYMFYSKSKQRAIIVNYIRSENRFVLWTVLPVGRQGTDDYPSTIKIYLEKLEIHDIITIQLK